MYASTLLLFPLGSVEFAWAEVVVRGLERCARLRSCCCTLSCFGRTLTTRWQRHVSFGCRVNTGLFPSSTPKRKKEKKKLGTLYRRRKETISEREKVMVFSVSGVIWRVCITAFKTCLCRSVRVDFAVCLRFQLNVYEGCADKIGAVSDLFCQVRWTVIGTN